MEAKVSDILENILGLLAMEGSFEVVEGDEEVIVKIDTDDAGRLIGAKGETIDALQLLINQIANKDEKEFKRIIIDVGDWRKNKEEELVGKAKRWADEALETGKMIELEPMPAWQRRVVHMVVSDVSGVSSESVGEGRDRHLILKLAGKVKKQKINLKSDDTS